MRHQKFFEVVLRKGNTKKATSLFTHATTYVQEVRSIPTMAQKCFRKHLTPALRTLKKKESNDTISLPLLKETGDVVHCFPTISAATDTTLTRIFAFFAAAIAV